MKNLELLFEHNNIKMNKKNVIIKKGVATYKNKDKIFNGGSIDKLLKYINALRAKFGKVTMPIHIYLGKIQFEDKLTYIFLEIICYTLIVNYGYKVKVSFNCEHNISIEGIASSPLLLLNDFSKNNMQKFVKKFSDDYFNRHYRRVVNKSEESDALSKRMDEIAYFLKVLGVENKSIDDISEVIIELVGNAWEHAETDCLIDLDVTSPYRKKKSDSLFLGINISIINFSERLLGERLRNRILNSKEDECMDKYLAVKKAYDIHKKSFDLNYTEEDFFNIASFQHRISGDQKKKSTGGTGLTKLISSLEKRSDAHRCYMISGKRALWFFHEYLEYDENGWIGFNEENNFLNEIPTHDIIGSNYIDLPGTAYNLNFVMEGKRYE